jgi:hypothetical protein
MNTETTLQSRIQQLEAQKAILEKALALQAIRQNEHSRNARIAIIQDELDAVKSITVKIERNLANNPILILNFEYDELI